MKGPSMWSKHVGYPNALQIRVFLCVGEEDLKSCGVYLSAIYIRLLREIDNKRKIATNTSIQISTYFH